MLSGKTDTQCQTTSTIAANLLFQSNIISLLSSSYCGSKITNLSSNLC